MYTTNNEMYLKFVTPQNNWGTTGTPQYRVTVQSDSCFCPLNYTIPQSILDPYTNKIGYACRLTATGKAVLTLAQANATYGTNNSLLYQLFYQKSIGLIGCTGTNPAPLCNISLGPIPRIVTKVSDINVSVPQISNGVGPYAYLWEIITQTGKYSNYGFLTSNTSAAPQIGPINATTVNLTNGTFEIKLTVTDSKGCKASTNATYIATV